MLELITNELKEIKGTENFYEYLVWYVYREENGDIYNGYGGFIRNDEDIMFNFDLRTFAPINREYFWQVAQKALSKLKVKNDINNERIDALLTCLLDMHKRINKGEDPMILNHMIRIEPETNEKVGPGW